MCDYSVSPNFTTINEIWKNNCVIHLYDSLLIGIFLALYIMPIARDTLFLM